MLLCNFEIKLSSHKMNRLNVQCPCNFYTWLPSIYVDVYERYAVMYIVISWCDIHSQGVTTIQFSPS